MNNSNHPSQCQAMRPNFYFIKKLFLPLFFLLGMSAVFLNAQTIDLELSSSANPSNPAIWSTASIDFTLTNTGSNAATGVEMRVYKPAGTVYQGGSEGIPSQGTFDALFSQIWNVGSIPAGGSATLTVNLFMLTADPVSVYAQVSAANENDPDSTPDNGNPTTPNEDDETVADLNGGVVGTCDNFVNYAYPFCDNSGTPNDASDDVFYFSIRGGGSNTGSSWSSNFQGQTFTGDYNQGYELGPFPFSAANSIFTIIGSNDPACTASAPVNPPVFGTCSGGGGGLPCTDNLMQNGGFENGLSGWSVYNGTASLASISSDAHSGSSALRLDAEDINTEITFFQSVDIPDASAEYAVSFWGKRLLSNPVGSLPSQNLVRLFFLDGSGTVLGNEWVNYVMATNYNEYALEFTCPANTATVEVHLSISKGNDNGIGSIFVDDFCMQILGGGSPGLSITNVACPTEYPLPGGTLTYSITVANNGMAASAATTVELYQDIGTSAPGALDPLYGTVNLPPIPAGGTATVALSGTLPSTPPTFYPVPFFFPSIYGGLYLSFGDTGANDIDFPLDFYCKKYNADVEISLSANDLTYGSGGIINYTVTITNHGPEKAWNLFSLVLENGLANGFGGTASSPSSGSILSYGTSPNSLVWHLPELAAGASATIEVQNQVWNPSAQPAPPANFTENLEVKSGHLIDPILSNNAASLTFTKTTGNTGLAITNIACPAGYPQPGQPLNFDISVQNNGATASPPTDLFINRQKSCVQCPPFNQVGIFTVPSIPGGSANTFNVSVVLPNDLALPDTYCTPGGPSSVTCVSYFDYFVSFEQSQFPAPAGSFQFYCKKYTTDLELQVIPNSPTYGTDGLVSFIFRATNNGATDAYNVAVNSFDGIVLPNADPAGIVTSGASFKVTSTDLQWDIPLLPANSSTDIMVNYDLLGTGQFSTLPNAFPLSASIGSGHLQNDPNAANNGAAFNFTKEGQTGGGIDLELSLAQPNNNPAQWSSYNVVATLNNTGSETATGVQVSFAKPAGVVYTGGNEYDASQGSFNPNGDEIWTVGSIPAGGSATMTVSYFLLANTSPDAYSQVSAANEADVDSTPGNGTPPSVNEDDEASTSGGTTPLPDLTSSDGSFPNFITQGTTVSYSITINNIGDAQLPSNSDSQVRVYLSLDPQLSGDDVVVASFFIGFPLSPGGSNVVANVPMSIPSNTMLGQHFLLVKVDANDNIAEGNENNNVSPGYGVQISPSGNIPVDLTVSNLTLQSSAARGSIVDYSFQINNSGTSDATIQGGFLFGRIFLSTDNMIGGGDNGFITVYTPSAGIIVPAGGSFTLTSNAQINPAIDLGNYFVYAEIDILNQVPESNESNNFSGLMPFEITNSTIQGVDLVAGNLVANISEFGGDQFLFYSFNAQNEGTPIPANQEHVTTGLYLSSDNSLSADDILITSVELAHLGGGSYFNSTDLITVPSSVAPGNYFIIAEVDDLEIYPETNEANNTTAVPASISGGPQPDLTISDLQIPNATVQAGQILNYDFDISNIADAAANGNFNVKAWISTDNILSNDDIQDGIVPTGNYAPGLTVADVQGASTIPAGLSDGVYFLILKVDADDDISESNEGNNVGFAPFTVGGGISCTGSIAFLTCDDNNTADPGDDLFSFIINMGTSHPNPPVTNWSTTINGVVESGNFGTLKAVGPYPISGGTLNFTVSGFDCSLPLSATPPAPCSDGGGGIDLSLAMSADPVDPAIYSNAEITLTINNAGPQTATGIVVDFDRPSGTVYTGGNEWSATQGSFNPFGNEEWTVGSIPAGGSASITVSYFLLSGNALTPYAQVISQNETDVDSSPGNGTCCTPNEDDEAMLTLNAFAGGGGVSLQARELIGRPVQLVAVNPNPVYHGKINVVIDSREEGRFELECFDLFGKLAFLQNIELEEGRNEVPLDVSDLRSGTYYLNIPGENWRGMPLRFVVARW